MGESARFVAVDALAAMRRGGAWSDAALHARVEKWGLDARDAALAMRLCYGVLQNKLWIDYALSRFSHTPPEKLEPRVLDILRISVYQLAFLDRVPGRAAVDEAVKLTRRVGSPKAAGLVNAVLRKVSSAGGLPEPPGDDPVAYLSLRHSHPRWLVERLIGTLGREGAEALLRANNAEVPVYAQVNPLKTDPGPVLAALEGAGVEAEPHPWLAGCLTLRGTGNLEKLEPFRRGEITVQDPAARLAVLAAGPLPGTRLLDICAAPGGKSFAAAMCMENRGQILACDVHEKKLARIVSGAERLGISIIETRAGDARAFDPGRGQFDTVIADVPCSGMGIIRKKPEIREKAPEEIAGLPAIQLDILRAAARYVRPGGHLLYCTCTVLPEENEGVVEAFVDDADEFSPEPFALPGEIGPVEDGRITLYPHIHGTDGFFLCKLRREE